MLAVFAIKHTTLGYLIYATMGAYFAAFLVALASPTYRRYLPRVLAMIVFAAGADLQ